MLANEQSGVPIWSAQLSITSQSATMCIVAMQPTCNKTQFVAAMSKDEPALYKTGEEEYVVTRHVPCWQTHGLQAAETCGVHIVQPHVFNCCYTDNDRTAAGSLRPP